MKTILPDQNSYHTLRVNKNPLLTLLILLILLPVGAFGQGKGKGKGKKYEPINITLDCVEYIGHGKYRAYFGYDNPNKDEIVFPEENSVIIKIKGNAYGHRHFKKGRNYKVYNTVFDRKDNVKWRILFPGDDPNDPLSWKEVIADIDSYLCQEETNILPYYEPPEGGKIINSVLSAELSSLNRVYLEVNDPTQFMSDDIFQISSDGTKVLIEIVALSSGGYSNMMMSTIITNNLVIQNQNPASLTVTGWFPIENLTQINSLIDYVSIARPVYPAITKNTGRGFNDGDKAIRSDFARNGFDITGAGVKVGVISDSYNHQGGAEADVANGDLPGPGNIDGNVTPVQVLQEYPTSFGLLSDEGRAMLQIVHDIAPGAELAFYSGFLDAADFANGIIDLKDAGSNVIVDDITYITEPFFRDGIVAQAVDAVKAQDVTYISAAGNYSDKSYQSMFNPSSSPSGITGDAHNFGGGDIYQNISLEEGTYTIVLQWEDNTNASQLLTNNDLDIYLSNENGTTLFGFNIDNTGGLPIEVLPFTVGEGGSTTNILITRASGTDNVNLKYIVFRGNLTINEFNTGSSTIVGQANAEGAIAVGAVLYSNTPEFGVEIPTIASFSSIGGTPVNGTVRQKPEITAPNGVETTVNLSPDTPEFDPDGDGIRNFHGTSAAAPHAAAVAALLIEARAKYWEGEQLLPDQIKTLLTSTAINMEETGFDYNTGFGFIQADAAIGSYIAPSPVLIELVNNSGLTPGEAAF
ncbi:MAG: S8 family serine peptidase, partial [Bacteroidales bacterium]|nr:S8 family serine peptidase [Bacteroidales bacterium]